nr:histone-lysine N-methyltransferase, H3 lysine-9 specific SUVH4 [Tanacetum cinerariifolium]
LIEPKGVVYECGPKCACGPSCVNRTTQRGLKHRLEVYKTPMKGWAVRSWDFIPSGAFVCEYIGVLKKAEDVNNPDNMYIM